MLRRREDFYRSSHPTAADVLLVIEVADTSLWYDTEIKVPLYALHGVPEVWIVDVENGQVTRYRDPVKGAYVRWHAPDARASIEIAGLEGVGVDLSAVVGG